MDLIIVLISIDIIASKFLDCYIASKKPEAMEQKSRGMFRRILAGTGIENESWISFFCTILVVVLSVYLLNNLYTAAPFQLLYIFTGLFTTILNLGSAHSGYFGRKNFISEKLLRN